MALSTNGRGRVGRQPRTPLQTLLDSVLGAVAAVVALGSLVALVGGVVLWWIDRGDGAPDRGIGESIWRGVRLVFGREDTAASGRVERGAVAGLLVCAIVLSAMVVAVVVRSVVRRHDVRVARPAATAVVASTPRLRPLSSAKLSEGGHTLVIGDGPGVVPLLEQLIADPTDTRPVVVVGAQAQSLAAQLDAVSEVETRTRQVHFHTASIRSARDLDDLGAASAHSIVLFGGGARTDEELARLAMDLHGIAAEHARITMELDDASLASSLAQVTGSRVRAVGGLDALTTMLTQVCLSPGAAPFIDVLLDARADNICLWKLTGSPRPFWRLVTEDERVTPIGVVQDDGSVELAPGADSLVDDTGRAIALDAAGVTPQARAVAVSGEGEALSPPNGGLSPREVAVVGWNRVAEALLARLRSCLPSGSVVHVVAGVGAGPIAVIDDARVRVNVVAAEPSQVTALRRLGREVDVIVVTPADGPVPSSNDAGALLSAMDIERARADRRLHMCRLVLALNQRPAMRLADLHLLDEIVVNENTVGRVLALVQRDPELGAVFNELLSPDGAMLVSRPVSDLVEPGTHTYGELYDRCALAGDVALGVVASGHVQLSPPRSSELSLGPGDELMVLTRRFEPDAGLDPIVWRSRAEPEPDADARAGVVSDLLGAAVDTSSMRAVDHDEVGSERDSSPRQEDSFTAALRAFIEGITDDGDTEPLDGDWAAEAGWGTAAPGADAAGREAGAAAPGVQGPAPVPGFDEWGGEASGTIDTIGSEPWVPSAFDEAAPVGSVADAITGARPERRVGPAEPVRSGDEPRSEPKARSEDQIVDLTTSEPELHLSSEDVVDGARRSVIDETFELPPEESWPSWPAITRIE